MGLDRFAIVRADVDIEPKHCGVFRSARDRIEFEHRGRKDQRPAMRNTGFDDEVGLDGPNNLLDGDNVLRVLNYRPSHPLEMIGIFGAVCAAHPRARCLPEVNIVPHRVDFCRTLALELCVFTHEDFLVISTRTS